MSFYQNEEIRVEGAVNVRQLRHFNMKEQLNEHMTFSLSGDISALDAEEYGSRKLLGQEVKIYGYTRNEETLLGCGIVTEAEINVRGETNSILLKGVSASWNMMTERKKRSFQNLGQTYREILKRIAGKDCEILYRCEDDERINTPVIQYNETDWDVLRRLAGRFHTVLVPEVMSGKPRVFFGKPKGNSHQLDDHGDFKFSVERNREGSVKLCSVTGQSADMRLGEEVVLEGRSWWIAKKQMLYQKDILETEYILGRMKDLVLSPVCNPELRGASIQGRVLKSRNESLKLWLDIDEEQGEKDAFWYPYLPETGNLMYAMPEKGTKVVLYFPNGEEKDGIVIHGFLDDSGKGTERNHKIKEMKTPFGKEISFYPGLVEISGGKKSKTNTLCLGETYGVQFISRKPVRILADEGISIQSGQSCFATAGSYLSVSQTGGRNQIEMMGSQLIFQAEKYYTASRNHKSKRPVTDRDNEPPNQSFSMLYGAFTGMMAQGESGAVNDKILGGMPALGSINGNIHMQNQMGLKIKRGS